MSFFKEFPHSRYYDTDLAWLIKRMKEIMEKLNELDEAIRRMEELRNEILELMTRLESIVTEIAERVIREEIGKYLPQNARPCAGYESINGAKSKMVYGNNGWKVTQNFNGTDGFRIRENGSSSAANAYLIAYETFDRFIFLWEFPASGGSTGISEGTCRLALTGSVLQRFNEDFDIDYDESACVYGNINPTLYVSGERLTENRGSTKGLGDIYCAHQLTKFTGTVHQFVMSVKKKTEGWKLQS